MACASTTTRRKNRRCRPSGAMPSASAVNLLVAPIEMALARGPLHVFVDARHARQIELDDAWDDERITSVTLLTVAEVAVRGPRMRITKDPGEFELLLRRTRNPDPI